MLGRVGAQFPSLYCSINIRSQGKNGEQVYVE